jgi:hypothetical protein
LNRCRRLRIIEGMRILTVFLLLLAAASAARADGTLRRADDASLAVLSSEADGERVLVSLQLGARPGVLRLVPMARLEAEFAPFAPAIAQRRDRVYEGALEGVAGSWARLTRIDGRWVGTVFDGTVLWYVEPAAGHARLAAARGLAADATLVYRGDDVDLPEGFDHGGHAARESASEALAGVRAPAGAPRYLKLTLVLDTEFQAVHGGNAASVAASVLNTADGLYRAQTDVQVSLHHLRALASNGTLTSTNPDNLLDAFTSFMPGSGIPFAGLAHLLSGKDFDGSTIGLAWVGTACSSGFGYGIDQITFTTALGGSTLAHEVGHNFDADHDSDGNACPSSGFVMAAVLNLGSPPTSFSSCSLGYFSGFFASPRACLDTPPAAADTVFRNGFE